MKNLTNGETILALNILKKVLVKIPFNIMTDMK